MKRGPLMERYAKDLLRDRSTRGWSAQQLAQDRLAVLACYFVVGFGIALLSGARVPAAAQFGLSLFIWGAVLRRSSCGT
jgi:stearoyl-CoA desaturase (delta-9 desaturase)